MTTDLITAQPERPASVRSNSSRSGDGDQDTPPMAHRMSEPAIDAEWDYWDDMMVEMELTAPSLVDSASEPSSKLSATRAPGPAATRVSRTGG